VALLPQRPLPPPTSTPPGGPAPLSGFWLGIAAAALAVASAVAALCKEIAARWRGIVVAHLFFLTLWMAIQVFFFATGAYWCVPSNGSRVAVWLTKSFAAVARCGPAPAVSAAFESSTAVAAPAPAPVPAPFAPVQALPRTPPFGASVSASAGVAPPSTGGTPPASGSAAGWSPRTIANCWRNRAVDSGDCYETADPRRRPPQPPPRYRYPEQRPPPNPCRRAYDCWPDDVWRHDL